MLAFASNRDGNFDVYVRRIEGGQEAINVINHPSEDFQPALSPDGKTNFPESGLFLEEPTITPDGRYLVYCRSNGGSSLWVLRLGNVQERVR